MRVATVRTLAAGFRWRCALCPASGAAPSDREALAGFEEHYARCHREDR